MLYAGRGRSARDLFLHSRMRIAAAGATVLDCVVDAWQGSVPAEEGDGYGFFGPPIGQHIAVSGDCGRETMQSLRGTRHFCFSGIEEGLPRLLRKVDWRAECR